MIKIMKYVTFMIRKDGLMDVVDTLSTFGAVMTQSSKDGKTYFVGLYCDRNAAIRCLDCLLTLRGNGVMIYHLNIRNKIKV